jgi:hypothetical protein
MKKYGRTTVSEFLGDFIVYRNLVPVDSRLPSLSEISEPLGLLPGMIPRKTTFEYARVITYLVEQARKLDNPGSHINRIVFIGDTRLNDGTAFRNICHSGKWPGIAFIASEQKEPLDYKIDEQEAGTLFLANRWEALAEFNQFCQRRDFRIDEHSAVLIDLDKTTLGARGRNDRVIDQVRLEAAAQTVGSLLGEENDPERFQTAYLRLNQTEFHAFTQDNQDYLVYICLMIGISLFDLESLVVDVKSGKVATFDEFLINIGQRKDELPVKLQSIHDDLTSRVQQGDPTPFKEFRYMEYKTTTARMGQMDASTPVDELLAQEITITQEVRDAALAWRDQGALLFGISDKPDEASIPNAKQESEGCKPIHQVETDAVGV